jgi:HSP20 family protein
MSEDVNRAVESLIVARANTASQAQSTSPMTSRSTASTTDLTDFAAWIPQVEVRRQPNMLAVRVDLPGVLPDELDVTVEDGVLTISGERSMERRDEDTGYVRSERSYGTFYRSIALPEGVDESRIEAKFDNGVLEIDVPIVGQDRSRRVNVRSARGNNS